jgi:hypothetical protein
MPAHNALLRPRLPEELQKLQRATLSAPAILTGRRQVELHRSANQRGVAPAPRQFVPWPAMPPEVEAARLVGASLAHQADAACSPIRQERLQLQALGYPRISPAGTHAVAKSRPRQMQMPKAVCGSFSNGPTCPAGVSAKVCRSCNESPE